MRITIDPGASRLVLDNPDTPAVLAAIQTLSKHAEICVMVGQPNGRQLATELEEFRIPVRRLQKVGATVADLGVVSSGR